MFALIYTVTQRQKEWTLVRRELAVSFPVLPVK